MTIAFVIGNGVSRQGIPLNDLKTRGNIYGCNALYRDFVPNVLVATDKPISTAIQESGYSAQNKFYTRKPIPGLGALPLPKEYYAFSSGPNATALAALDGNKRIYLVGFDMGPTKNQKFNNIYADTDFYRKRDSVPTYTGNWIKQLIKISNDFSKVQFIRVQGPTTANIKELESLKNFSHLSLNTFLDLINNQKDL